MTEVNFLVKKGLTVPKGSAATPSVIFDASDPDTGLYSPGADRLAISTNGTGRLFVDASGKVGLGTSAPEQLLQIESVSSPTIYIKSANATAGTFARLEFGNGTDATSVKSRILSYRESASDARSALAFETTNASGTTSEALRIDHEGRVGVGTTSPTANLSVVHTAGNGFNVTRGSGSISLSGNYGGSGDKAVIQTNTGLALAFHTSGDNERARIDSSGRLLVGMSSARENFDNATSATGALIESASNQFASLGIVTNSNSLASNGGRLILARSEGTSPGSDVLVVNNDKLGTISYQGHDGTEFVESARIAAEVDGTPGANDMPGRLVFSVTADGSASPAEAMRIKNSRIINIANTPTYADNAAAKAGGLVNGDVYRTATGALMIVYT